MVKPKLLTPTVAIVGAGPAGLRAATKLASQVSGQVLVLDREGAAGGIPRHSDHLGYGIRDRKRLLTGPTYAKVLAAQAAAAGADIRTQTTVTGWAEDGSLLATSPAGRIQIRAEVILLATGARERPRAARMIPGDRAEGVLTTGQLQNLVHIHHQKVGTRAVIVGAELVSWSAALTLASTGCRIAALVSSYRKAESYALLTYPGKLWFRTQVMTSSEVIAVHGRPRVSSVTVRHRGTGQLRSVDCDTVVFTGDWIPDHELVRMAGITIDPASGGPLVDTALRTSQPGVFAVGNLNHPVDTADVVALEGEFVADRIVEYLHGMQAPAHQIRLLPKAPLRWVSPGIYRPGDPGPARSRLVSWVDVLRTAPVITVTQGGREIARTRVPWAAAPGRAFRIPAKVLAAVQPSGGDVTIGLR